MCSIHCGNCAGSNSSSSKQCPMWAKECAIQKRKVHEKLSYSEAKKLVEAGNPPIPSRRTYAGVTAKVSFASQTDIKLPQKHHSIIVRSPHLLHMQLNIPQGRNHNLLVVPTYVPPRQELRPQGQLALGKRKRLEHNLLQLLMERSRGRCN